MNFFTSDVHLGSEQIINQENRPFRNSKEYEKFIVKLWNKQAKKGDTIFVIGDFLDCPQLGDKNWQGVANRFVKKIKAEIILIVGNHEERIIQAFFNGIFENFRYYCLQIGFKNVYKDFTLKINNEKFYLTHRPINKKRDMNNLFGHVHRGGGIFSQSGFNVGCDLNHFKLYSEQNIIKLMQQKSEFWGQCEDLVDYLN